MKLIVLQGAESLVTIFLAIVKQSLSSLVY